MIADILFAINFCALFILGAFLVLSFWRFCFVALIVGYLYSGYPSLKGAWILNNTHTFVQAIYLTLASMGLFIALIFDLLSICKSFRKSHKIKAS